MFLLNGTKGVDEYVLKSPSVDGVFMRLHWNLLETADNKYDSTSGQRAETDF